ncbi:MAG: DUF4339 domain-containing protein, partial [Muribaculaceae bacterium]|nr:DUF4339 domain-containing protein [Muribaculaceae bacterium]
MLYYIIENGMQIGPLSEDQLQSHVITPSTPVWTNGMPQWTNAGQVPELAQFIQAAPVYQTPQAPAYQPQAVGQGEVPPRSNSHLALAIVACVIGGLFFGLASLILAIKSKAAYGRKDYVRARRLGKHALIWGIIGLVLGIALAIVVVILVVN